MMRRIRGDVYFILTFVLLESFSRNYAGNYADEGA